MKVSVVIPTYNRLGRLKQVLHAFEHQDFPLSEFEVLVVSDGSTDGTEQYLQSLQTCLQLRLFYQKNQGVAVARNTGMTNARGEILLFVDDDVVPSASLIREHFESHQKTSRSFVVLGPMLSPSNFQMLPWVEWEQAMLVKQYDAMQSGLWEPTARQFFTGNTSLPREEALKAGGFDPSFRRAEDVELAYRLAEQGLQFRFNPRAKGFHFAERSFNSWMGIPYAYGMNDVIFHKQKGQTWLLPTIRREFYTRNSFIQILVYLCLDRPVLRWLATNLLKQIALISHRLKLSKISNMAFSGIFNLRYYQGVSDQLGGRKLFLKGMFNHYAKAV